MTTPISRIEAIFKRYAGSYQYSLLDEENQEIRLLTLLRGCFSADIHITLRTEILSASHIPKYEALSYVWGSTNGPKRIFVKTQGQPKQTLSVTPNLAQALR